MQIEQGIIAYLTKYGNTKESDLINYGAQKLDHPADEMKKILNRMTVKGKIYRVVHDKLKPPEVYISLKEPLPSEIEKIILEIETFKEMEVDVQKILKEAATIAERRTTP